ncbi:MAG: DUF4932 domain-containing protein [bacterium]|nr:DUF4932 domain-containing protein [bacterium]
MKKLLLTLWFCALAIAAASAQEKCNVVYEGEKVLLCTNDYVDTYLLAVGLKYDFQNANMNNPAWVEAKEYFTPYKKHAFLRKLDKYVDKQSRMAHFMVNNPLIRFGLYGKNISTNDVKGVFSSKKDFENFIAELEKFYNDTNAGEFLNKYKEQIKGQLGTDANFDAYLEFMEEYIGKDNLANALEEPKYVISLSVFKEYEIACGSSTDGIDDYYYTLASPLNNAGDIDIEAVVLDSFHWCWDAYISMFRRFQGSSNMINELAQGADVKDYVNSNWPWWRVAYVSVSQALTAKICADKADAILGNAQKNGLKKVMRPYNALAVYEQNRDKYPSLDLYIDELIKSLFVEE